MRTTIFSKAIRLQKYLNETGGGNNKLFFEYDFGDKEKNIQVELTVEDNKTLIKNTGLHGTINIDNQNCLDSYKIGVIFYLLKKQMRR